MTAITTHRLEGLEPDNLLAFLALLGLLRALEESRSDWHARVSWTVSDPPLRPALRIREDVDGEAVVEAVAEGIGALAQWHEFDGHKDLTLTPGDAATCLQRAVEAANPYGADLWASLLSDAAVSRDGKKVEPTPLCLMFGQGHQYFLDRLTSVPRRKSPPNRGKGRSSTAVSETQCLWEALFEPWRRPDATQSFRWDPHEDVRYALRARNPTDAKTKETTQHGANRLAAIGLSVLTVAPKSKHGQIRLVMLGGERESDGNFVFRWPIWREPTSLAGVRALLSHPGLKSPDAPAGLGIVELRQARRISAGKFMNVTRAEPVSSRDLPPT